MAHFFARLVPKRPDFPAGAFGMLAQDPATAIGSYTLAPMMSAVVRPRG